MAKKVITDATILYANVDISSESHDVAIESETDPQVATNYQSQGWEEILGGIKRNEISLKAFLTDEDDPDKIIWDIDNPSIFVAPQLTPAAGDLAWMMHGLRAQQNRRYTVGTIAAIDIRVTSTSGPLLRGVTLHHENDIDESFGSLGVFYGSEVNAGAVLANQRVYADLLVRRIEGTTPTLDVIVESDTAGFPTPTTRITFDQVTDISAAATRYQAQSLAGAITDTRWRGKFTVGGTGVAIDLTLFLAIA